MRPWRPLAFILSFAKVQRSHRFPADCATLSPLSTFALSLSPSAVTDRDLRNYKIPKLRPTLKAL